MVRGAGVKRLFKGGNQFKYFSQREAIIRGRRLIEGQLLFQEIQYLETDMQPSVYKLFVNYIVDAFVWSSFNLLFLEQIRKKGLKEGLKACFISGRCT